MKIVVKIKNLLLAVTLVAISGCASTPMASKEQDVASKTFKAPSPNMTGIYIYRNSSYGAALLKTVSIDKNVIGATAAKTFFHREIPPGEHTLATQSEFGDNELPIKTEVGKNYFIRQYIKMGVFVGGAGLESVTDAEGKKGVLECNEALSSTVINAPATEPVKAATPTAPVVTMSTANTFPTQNESSASKLRALNLLYKEGVISQKDFETKKQEILKSM